MVPHRIAAGYRSIVGAMSHSAEQRIARVRELMQAQRLDAIVVRSTDRYLNEYVPDALNNRQWLTGFTGSTGDAIVTRERAMLFVDGRYHLQAETEADTKVWTIMKQTFATGIEGAWADTLRELAQAPGLRGVLAAPSTSPLRVGFEPDRVSLQLHELMLKRAGTSIDWVANDPSLVEVARGPTSEPIAAIRSIDPYRGGGSTKEKVAAIRDWMSAQSLDALVVQKLDEVAWLTNLRGTELPYQSTFRATAIITRDTVLLVTDPSRSLPSNVSGIDIIDENSEWTKSIARGASQARVGIDAEGGTVAMTKALERAGLTVVKSQSPVAARKAQKTEGELIAMRDAFQRADGVHARAREWCCAQVLGGQRVTEADLARKVEELFIASGAVGLSFRVIAGAGANGAVVHHPSHEDRVILPGEVVLLDAGGYYDEGYATDLTRTFWIGEKGATAPSEARHVYTHVLKASIAGMGARIPATAFGAQLDGLIRAPIWAAGYEYSHGTGHGVGINVHESPPRIASTSMMRLLPGHVFSIEPGVYLTGKLGVRIENLCTVEVDPENAGFLRVKPLTFSPLDERLIDETFLTNEERAWLAAWNAARVAS